MPTQLAAIIRAHNTKRAHPKENPPTHTHSYTHNTHTQTIKESISERKTSTDEDITSKPVLFLFFKNFTFFKIKFQKNKNKTSFNVFHLDQTVLGKTRNP